MTRLRGAERQAEKLEKLNEERRQLKRGNEEERCKLKGKNRFSGSYFTSLIQATPKKRVATTPSPANCVRRRPKPSKLCTPM